KRAPRGLQLSEYTLEQLGVLVFALAPLGRLVVPAGGRLEGELQRLGDRGNVADLQEWALIVAQRALHPGVNMLSESLLHRVLLGWTVSSQLLGYLIGA